MTVIIYSDFSIIVVLGASFNNTRGPRHVIARDVNGKRLQSGPEDQSKNGVVQRENLGDIIIF